MFKNVTGQKENKEWNEGC